MAIWQDLVDTCGFTAGYQSVRRFVRKLQRKPLAGSLRGHRDRTRRRSPGRLRRPARWSATRTAGKYRRTRLFVLTLGYSRKSVRLLVFRSSSQIWAELHEKAFRRLGGCHTRRCAR